MKKRLEAELISIAHRILRLKSKYDLFQLHIESQRLYEALSVLKFVEENIGIIEPKINVNEIKSKLQTVLDGKQKNEIVDNNTVFEKKFEYESITPQERKSQTVIDNIKIESFTEPNYEKVNDSNILKEAFVVIKNETNINKKNLETPKLDTLVDESTGILNISLNDRIGITLNLFDNNHEDYNRVLSQLSSIKSFTEAKNFIQNIVKVDYNNWEDKEDFELRFMDILEKNFKI